MQVLSVTGGSELRGTVRIHGAKNSVLPILAASVLCEQPCVIHNCPDISDVETALKILSALGCRWQRKDDTLIVDSTGLSCTQIPAEPAREMRSSIVFAGALLARCAEASVPMPGGCPLGKRPVDLHLAGFTAMGAAVSVSDGIIDCRRESLHPAEIVLPFPSVGATENLLLAAMGCAGEIRILNAAREPEIEDLARFLQSCGAKIEGAGTERISVSGGRPLHGTEYTVMPDRMEAATYLCACAGCGGDVTLAGAEKRTLLPVIEVLQTCGCAITEDEESIRIQSRDRLHMAGRIETAPHPGFPTDAQALLMAALARAEGELEIRETIFENRFRHVPELQKLGADVKICGDTARLRGVETLHGAALQATDLRAAAALTIGAVQAEEKSVITGVKHLKRGYDNLEKNLRSLGADICLCEL